MGLEYLPIHEWLKNSRVKYSIHGVYGIYRCDKMGYYVDTLHVFMCFFRVVFKHTSLSAHSEPIAKSPRMIFHAPVLSQLLVSKQRLVIHKFLVIDITGGFTTAIQHSFDCMRIETFGKNT